MFAFDEELFMTASDQIDNAISNAEVLINTANLIKSMSFDYDFKSEVDNIINNINMTLDTLNELSESVGNTKKIINFNGSIQYLDGIDFTNIPPTLLLNLLIKLANSDSQINTSYRFENLTDFQNIMLSNLSFLELFYGNNPDDVANKTIGDLWLETYSSASGYNLDDYLSFSLDTDTIVSLANSDAQEEYRNLFLGKLVTYGFSGFTIKELVNGDNGFDAIVLEDVGKNTLVYYSCTDLNEFDDYLYDAYPILNSLSNTGNTINQLVGAKNVYDSQQFQALELLKKYLSNSNGVVNVGGFSLGGSLAEYSYFSLYDNNNIGDLILFNPYHLSSIDENVLNTIVDSGKLKLYVAEGDAVSTVFNYDNFSNYSQPIYIDYPTVIEQGRLLAISDNNLLNRVSTNLKNAFLDNAINSIDQLPWQLWLPPTTVLRGEVEGIKYLLREMKTLDVNSQEYISLMSRYSEYAQPILELLGVNVDLNFIKELECVEILFSGVHMPYSVEINRNTSFNSSGQVLPIVNDNNVEYPTFEEMSNIIFGSNVYDDIKDLIYNLEN